MATTLNEAPYHPRPERWPQFTLKGLLVATTLAAFATGWGIAQYRRHVYWKAIERKFRDSQPYRVPATDLME